MSIRSLGSASIGALIGGALVWIGQSGSFRLTPGNMSYADLAATLLAAVGVIVAIFGGVFAIAAIWGFAQLKKEATAVAVEAGLNEIKTQVETGSLRTYIKGEIERLADEEFKSERMDQRIGRRVDAVVFGRPQADRLLDDDDENGGQV